MAAAGTPALYQSQAVESAGQGAGPSARGTGGGLSAHDLRPKPRGGGAGARWLPAQVETALQGGQCQLRGGRRRALHLYQFPELAMESATYHQRAGTDQRGISPADQNPSFTPQRRGRAVLALRPLAQRSSAAATPGRLAGSD